MSLEIRGERIGVATSARDWHNASWPLTMGCRHVSKGCVNCSAEVMVGRTPHLARYADGRKWTGVVDTQPHKLHAPWKPHHWVFVSPLSDLFHPQVPTDFIREAVGQMARYPETHFGILTKRAERLAEVFDDLPTSDNVMVGVTVEANEYRWRLDELLKVDARIRWVSAEPLLEMLDLRDYLGPERINWIAAGPETGVNARPCRAAWMRSLLHQCRAAEIPFFTKHGLDGADHRGMPD